MKILTTNKVFIEILDQLKNYYLYVSQVDNKKY